MHGNDVYEINLDEKTGSVTKVPDGLRAAYAEAWERYGGLRIGEEKVAGKLCEIREQKAFGLTTWLWKGIDLRTEMVGGPFEVTKTAIRVEIAVQIPEERFEVPAGVEIAESEFPDLTGR